MAGEKSTNVEADAASVRAAAKAMMRRISNEKGQFTRRETKIMTMVEKGDGAIANSDLFELDKKAEIILNLFHELIESCPADEISAHGAAKAKADDDMNKRQIECMKHVMSLPMVFDSGLGTTRSGTAAAANSLSANTSRITFREQTGLRPDILQVSSTMTEFEAWKDAFESYFHASNMQLLAAEQQFAYLKNRLGPELRVRLKGTVPSSASRQDCFGALDKVFAEKYPLFQRRLAWFKFCNKKDDPIKQTYYNLKEIADEADMDKMTIDDWHMFKVTYLYKDNASMFHDLLKVENPTLQKVLEAGTAWEAAASSREAVVPKAAYRVADADDSSGDEDTTPILAIQPGGCNHCALLHAANVCKAATKKCFECSEIGHYGRVCKARVKIQHSAPRRSAMRTATASRRPFHRSSTPGERDRSQPSTSEGEEADISSVMVETGTPRVEMVCGMGSNKRNLVVLADTGAAKSVFPASCLPPSMPISPSSVRLRAANGSTLRNSGEVFVTGSLGVGPKANIKAVISSDLHGPPLIGFRDLRELGVELRFPDRTPIVESRSNNTVNFIEICGDRVRISDVFRWLSGLVRYACEYGKKKPSS